MVRLRAGGLGGWGRVRVRAVALGGSSGGRAEMVGVHSERRRGQGVRVGACMRPVLFVGHLMGISATRRIWSRNRAESFPPLILFLNLGPGEAFYDLARWRFSDIH